MSVHIGTSGWNYPGGAGTWNGIFYPKRRPKGFDELAYYAEHFDAVEVNSTFYRQPEPSLSEGWVRRTPAGFGFAVKLYQKFTHPDMFLKKHGTSEWDVTHGDLDQFRAGVGPIAESDRLLAVLMQFPPSFQAGPDAEGYLDWLTGALAGYPVAVELRHRSWSDQHAATQALLDARQAAWVLIDEPKFASSVRQPIDLTPGASPLAYLRLHGRNSEAWWQPDDAEDRYNYQYSATELAPFAEATAKSAKAGRRVLAFMNNHFSAKAVASAAILKHQLGQLVPGDYPRTMVERYPELEGVVRTEGLPL